MEVYAKVFPEIVEGKRSETRLYIGVRNNKKGCKWFEADVEVPPTLSLVPDYTLRKAKVRLGILRNGEFLTKYVKLFSSEHTKANVYEIVLTVYSYNKKGIVDERIDLLASLNVVTKREEIIR